MTPSSYTSAYFPDEFAAARDLLKKARRIVIFSHRGPDGDTVGANLALRRVLTKQWGKEVRSVCVDAPPRSSSFLPDFDSYLSELDLSWPDLLVSVDCGSSAMIAFGSTTPTLFDGSIPFINLDHHPSNDEFGTVNIVDAKAAAACQILYRFFVFCEAKIDRQIATALLHGLYYDTGSFMHSNTNPDVLQIASELLWKGADFKTIVKNQFHTMPVPQLRVYGCILERAHVNDKGVTVSTLNQDDFDSIGATADDTTGAIDYLNSIPDGKVACLLYENRKGELKGSLRTRRDDINLSKLAGLLGGGGHAKASGFSMPGHLSMDDDQIRITRD